MEAVGRILDKLREWIDQLVDALRGREPQSQHQPIPIPVRDRRH